MSKIRIEGSFVALVTPFNHDGSVDYGAFESLLSFQARHGTRAVLIMGSTGEVSMLTADERRDIIRRTARLNTQGMKLFYGCTGNSTQSSIDNVRYARDNGYLAPAPGLTVEEVMEAFTQECRPPEIRASVMRPRFRARLTAAIEAKSRTA